MSNPAATGGTRIMCSTKWYEAEPQGRGRRGGGARDGARRAAVRRRPPPQPAAAGNPATRNPGWLTEGIPDYIRWFKYEPQTHGADIRNPAPAKYDASYRVIGQLPQLRHRPLRQGPRQKLNAAMRQGKYSEDLWKEYTGKTAPELAEEWKQSLEKGK